MTEKEEIILEHTRLTKEYVCLPKNAVTQEENKHIEQRKETILQRIEVLKNIENEWTIEGL